MEHIEMIDKLREKAGISREEAADALTRADWDMLEALVILEREGKIAPLTSSVVTSEGSQNSGCAYGAVSSRQNGGPGLVDKIRELLHNSVTYSLIVRRGDKTVISLPVLIFILIILFLFKITAVALVVGLICGCRYSIENNGGENGGNAG